MQFQWQFMEALIAQLGERQTEDPVIEPRLLVGQRRDETQICLFIF